MPWPREARLSWGRQESLLREDVIKSELELAGRVCVALSKYLLGEWMKEG